MVGADLEPGVLSAGSSSFVVVDFFDFESQATPLLPGMSPAFDFATTFKVCSVGLGIETNERAVFAAPPTTKMTTSSGEEQRMVLAPFSCGVPTRTDSMTEFVWVGQTPSPPGLHPNE